MTLPELLAQLRNAPETVAFSTVQAVIAAHYVYTPTRFTNGLGDDAVVNEAGTNEGSCRLFAFARLQGLGEAETLACFGHFYRDEVLGNPEGSSHANIRRFMRDGWAGIRYEGEALVPVTA